MSGCALLGSVFRNSRSLSFVGPVFVTFEEAPSDLMQNVRSFGWDLEGLVAERKIAVVDAPGSRPVDRDALASAAGACEPREFAR